MNRLCTSINKGSLEITPSSPLMFQCAVLKLVLEGKLCFSYFKNIDVKLHGTILGLTNDLSRLSRDFCEQKTSFDLFNMYALLVSSTIYSR